MNEQQIFSEALEFVDDVARAEFLQSACSDESERRRIERLLKLHRLDNLPMDTPAAAAISELDESPTQLATGEFIGPYRLLEQIGEGGMGVVFMAEQKAPVRRMVAVKVVKPGMDSRQVIARFESERQALAMMEHPNIAHVLDVGATESGRPYFVMELVKGVPITEFCQKENITIRDRLELFVEVCRAIQHSHSKGIIHRDIKPSNVMVTIHDGKPFIKIIDFGVAKALNTQLTERTLFTSHGQIIGTPLYMSPEQAEMSGLDVDIRSDIYSLGVLLYELLTGYTPFDEQRLREASHDEMRRIIREEDPPRPSLRISTAGSERETITDKRKVTMNRTSELLRGELDWIVIRALEKNRTRRYQTAQEFRHDITRYLQDKPVEACPPSRTYWLRKTLARNKGVAISVTIASFLLITGTVVSTAFAMKASRATREMSDARDASDLKARIATAISNFLRNDLLRSSLADGADRSISLREALDKASVGIEGRYSDQPLVEAEIRLTLGLAYNALSEQKPAGRHLSRVHDLQVEALGATHRETLKTLFYQAMVTASYDRMSDQTLQERSAAAALQFESTYKLQQSSLGELDPDVLVTMGHTALCYSRSGRFSEAHTLFDHANRLFELSTEPNDVRAIDCLEQTIASLRAHEKFEEAETQQQSVKERRKLETVEDQRNAEENIEQLRELVTSRERALGTRDAQTIEACLRLTDALMMANRADDAAPVLLQVLQTQQDRWGETDERTAATRGKLGQLYLQLKDLDKALEHFKAVLDQAEVDTATMQSLKYIAEALKFQGRFLDAAKLHGTIAETEARLYGEDDPRTIRSLRDEGATFSRVHNVEELERVVKELERIATKDHQDTIFCQLALADEYLKRGEYLTALEKFEPLHVRVGLALGPTDPLTLVAGSKLVKVYQELKRIDESEELSRKMLNDVEAAFGLVHVHTFIALCQLGSVCADKEEFREAVEFCNRASVVQAQLNSNAHQKVSNLDTLARVFKKIDLAGGLTDRIEYETVIERLLREANEAGNTRVIEEWSKTPDLQKTE